MPRLVINCGEDAGLEFPTKQRIISLGRSPSNTIHLNDKKLSRYHAELMRRGDRYYIRDLNSTNGTYVNEARVLTERPLNMNDIIRIGNTEMAYEPDDEPLETSDSTSSKVVLQEDNWGHTTGQVSAGISQTSSYKISLSALSEQVPQHHFKTLCKVSEAISSILDLDELLETLIDIIVEEFKPDRGIILLRPEDSSFLDPRAVRSSNSDENITVSRSIVDRAMSERVSLLVDDAKSDRRFSASESVIAQRIRTAICAPMINKDSLVGVIYIDTQSRLISYNKQDLTLLNSIASQAAVSISNARLHSKIVEQKQIENELEIAHSIQRNLLPKEMPSIDGFEIAALCIPAKHVGGDYYDFIPLENDNLGIAVADVSGKGVPAAILSSSVRAALQVETRYSQHSVSDMIQKINTMAWRDTTSSMFLSMVFGVLDASRRSFTYVNAGHNYPMLFLPDGSRIDLNVGGTLLGIAEEMSYQQGTVDLPKGSVLVVYTDGVIDIQNEDGESMGLDELTSFIESRLDQSPGDLIQQIYEYAFRFKGEADPYDDFTLIVLRSD